MTNKGLIGWALMITVLLLVAGLAISIVAQG